MSVRRRVLLLCPGRGAYGREDQGSLQGRLPADVERALDQEDARRAERGLPALRELDRPGTFRPGTHLAGANASLLTYTVAALAARRVLEEGSLEVAAVAGNSMGWYTALAVAGCLSFAEGLRLVARMAELQEEHARGGQLLHALVDEEWRVRPEGREEMEEAVAAVAAQGEEWFVAPSIHLGGHAVVAGTGKGLDELVRRLPRRKVGSRTFPFLLAGHGPYHSRLCAEVSRRAWEELADLRLGPPRHLLVDGRGGLHTPWSADPAEVRAYTLGVQVTEPFDFTAAVRVGLLETAPDQVLCLPPGTSLSAPVAHVMVREGWRGLASRTDFLAAQQDPGRAVLEEGTARGPT